MDAKVEHLKLIQGVVSRLAANSFMLKGWTVTLVAALFAFASKDADKLYVLIAWMPVLVFAGLDSYFLQQERMFRDLYDKARLLEPTDFAMDTKPFREARTWAKAIGSRTILWFYGVMLTIVAVFTLIWLVRG